MSHDTDWRKSAVCRTKDPELFFPKGTEGPWALAIEEAKAACRRCPAVEACLQFAFQTGIDHGIFGGLTEAERRSLRRRANAGRITGDNITKSAQRARQPQEPRTLRSILDANTARVGDGHLTWTGPEQIHFKGRVYTPRQAAFIVDRGYYPTGRITSICGVPDCVLAAHIEDYEERTRCGTRPGYQRHLRERTEVCGPCRQANTDADNRLRRSGSTKAVAV
ncbi:transcription factor WhiB [Streptomyces sp. Ag109_O5-1]|nr:transcription factor WhiB [Streptomyces sp. Ag109_O5-1]